MTRSSAHSLPHYTIDTAVAAAGHEPDVARGWGNSLMKPRSCAGEEIVWQVVAVLCESEQLDREGMYEYLYYTMG